MHVGNNACGIAEFHKPPVLCDLPRFLQDGAQPRGQLPAPSKGCRLEYFDQCSVMEDDFPFIQILLAPLFLAIMRGAARGACNIVHATTAEGLQNGGYYREE